MELQDSERDIFIAEISEKIDLLNDALLRFEASPSSPETLNLLFRIAHTIKGNASFVDLTPMVEIGHALEDGFSALREGTAKASKDVLALFYRATDVISTMLEKYRHGEIVDNSEHEGLTQEIARSLAGKAADALVPAPDIPKRPPVPKKQVVLGKGDFAYQIEIKLHPSTPMPGMRAYLMRKKLSAIATIIREKPESGGYEEKSFSGFFGFIVLTKTAIPEIRKALLNAETEHLVIKRLKPKTPQPSMTAEASDQTRASAPNLANSGSDSRTMAETQSQKENESGELLRVPSRKIDDLINLVGELLSNNSVYTQLNQEFRKSIGNHVLFPQYRDNAEEMARIIADLQEKVLKVRMVPINSIFSRFARVIRDYNSKHPEKQVRLSVLGGDTEIDKGQIENLYEPLLHMVRNSMDHGIELRSDRIAAGKRPDGEIILSASQEGNNIYIEIRDDGAGLNETRIREKAVEKGFATAEEIGQIPKGEIFNYIFMPGFSTAAAVTDISGRGVGMDVVKRSIEELHGRVVVESEQNKGSAFRIALPLSLAIVTALRIRVRRSSMAIPITSIVETIKIKKSGILKLDNVEAVDVRGKHVPVLSLATEMGVRSSNEIMTDDEHVVIVQVRQGRVGFRVDELFGYEDMVIKSLSKNFETVDGVSGAAILGRGNICLILDPQKMVDVVYSAERHSGTNLLGKHPLKIQNALPDNADTNLIERILESSQENALAALRQLTGNSEINLEYRSIRLKGWANLTKDLEAARPPTEKYFYTTFESGVQGIQFIRIEESQTQALARLFYGEQHGTLSQSDVTSAITELTNIVSVSLTNAMTIHGGLRIYPTIPHEASTPKELQAALQKSGSMPESEVLTMDIQFQTESKETLFGYSVVLAKSLLRGMSAQAQDY